MFDTPGTAFYHGPSPNVKNVKSLFSPLIPSISSIPNISSLSGYFQQPFQQQPSQQEVKLSSVDISTDLITAAPTAPQQPTHSNKRSRERRTVQRQQQNSVSSNIATTTTSQRVIPSNMGNVGSSKTSSASSSASSSNHHHHRRKKHLNKINRKKVDEAITLSAFAVEEDNQGNYDVAMEFYLSAIENMLEALPIHTNQSRKDALKNKLRDFMDREGLTDDFMESTNASSAAKASEREKVETGHSSSGISEHIIQAAITSAVALKQSPIPDAISATVNYTMRKIQKIDQTYGLQDKAWEISRTGINLALEIDKEYNVHEKVGNALFTGIAAAMKAGIAYKDSPSYREIQKLRTEYQLASAPAISQES
uniref:Suppressor protein of bem1/bed5 double mutants n=1 Tax=Anthurium amnicola TaxID=1678845 RepID=A0A1D1Y956_9ARAE